MIHVFQASPHLFVRQVPSKDGETAGFTALTAGPGELGF